MKVILFITASCLLHSALAAPDHQLKGQKHHKASAVADMEDYLEAERPADELNVELKYGLPAAAKDSDNVDALGLPLSSNTPFPPDVPSFTNNWKKVGYLDICPIQPSNVLHRGPRYRHQERHAARRPVLHVNLWRSELLELVIGQFAGDFAATKWIQPMRSDDAVL